MEIWISIGAFLIFGLISYLVCEAYENIQMNRWMRQRHLRELKLAMRQLEHPEFFSRTHDVSADEIRRAMHTYKTSGVTTYLPTGEVEALGPGTIIFREGITDEAERLIKEAHNRTID